MPKCDPIQCGYRRKEKRTMEPFPIADGSEKILLVDDDPNVAEIFGAILSRLGYQVTTRTNSSDTGSC